MQILNNTLDHMVFETKKSFGQLSIVPISTTNAARLDYLTMPEVLTKDEVNITELDGGASVPELSITNNSTGYVLLVDGEELVGAKQNRVLNTTLIIQPGKNMRIPVSCTEAGRWEYRSKNFQDSGVVLPFRNRYNKKVSIDSELASSGKYKSNQGQVWDDISRLEADSDSFSPTSAMRDIYESKMPSLEEFVLALQPEPGQVGMLVYFGEEIAGLEIFSKESAFKSLAPKLIKSYAIDLLSGRGDTSPQESYTSTDEFISGLRSATAESYKSVGEGWDYRFSGESVTGTALCYDEEVIHAAFYNHNLADRLNQKRSSD